MDNLTILATALKAIENQNRITKIYSTDSGIAYVDEKGNEVEVDLSFMLTEQYDDSEVFSQIENLKNLISEQSVSFESLNDYIGQIESALKVAGEEIERRIQGLSESLEGKSDSDHSHEQYLTEDDFFSLFNQQINVDKVEESLNQIDRDIDSSFQKLRAMIDELANDDSIAEHSHAQYVTYSELYEYFEQNQFDPANIFNRIIDNERELSNLRQEINSDLSEIKSDLKNKPNISDHKDLEETIKLIDKSKSNTVHQHPEYVLKEELEKFLPEQPNNIVDAEIDKDGYLMIELSDGSFINAGQVAIEHKVSGGGISRKATITLIEERRQVYVVQDSSNLPDVKFNAIAFSETEDGDFEMFVRV